MSAENGGGDEPQKPKERRAWPGGPTKSKLEEMLEHNRQVRERVHQPKLIDTEPRCGDCGNPMSECQCLDRGVGHKPGRVPR